MKRDNQYLYGTDEVPEIPKCILERRLELIELNLTKVLDVPMSERDNEKMNYLIKAREFWQEMKLNNGGY